VPLEALNTALPEEPPPPVPRKPAAAQTKPRLPAAPKPSEPPAPDPETAPQRPPIQEIVPADEEKRLEASVQKHKADIISLKAQAQQGHRLTANQKSMLVKIDQFVAQCDQAKSTGDMRSADEFAEKANILAKELQSGK
jgi:heme-binding NEAT domain protein